MSDALPVAEAALGYVCAISPYVTGKPIDAVAREFGLTDIIKLASNENPLGASPKAQAALRDMPALHLYPDGGGFALKHALAQKFAVPMDGIVLGNGSNDLLELAARAYLSPGTNAVFSAHAFAVYALATQAVGATAKVVPALPPDHPEMPYGADLPAMRAAIDEHTRVVFLANPNNPTGTWVDAAALEAFVASVPSRVLIVLDEAYSEYVPPEWFADGRFPDGLALAKRYPNILLTRTFSKIYGLAALRVGFGLAHPSVAAILERVRQPFNVNALAQQAAVAALADEAFIQRSRAVNDAGLQALQAECAARGWPVIPSRANFVTVHLGVPAGRVFDALLREGVIIRPLGGQQDTGGLSCFVRITVGTAEQNARVIAALDRVLPAVQAVR